MISSIISKLRALALVGLVLTFTGITMFSLKTSAASNTVQSSYNPDIAAKLTSRCDLVKDYLSQTARINELAARQNMVRGWEYILRQLSDSKSKYQKFNISYDELASSISSLDQQLQQFKDDFETYDTAFDRLTRSDCVNQPQNFWQQLETLRSFRSGISLASDNFKASLDQVLSREEAKW